MHIETKLGSPIIITEILADGQTELALLTWLLKQIKSVYTLWVQTQLPLPLHTFSTSTNLKYPSNQWKAGIKLQYM